MDILTGALIVGFSVGMVAGCMIMSKTYRGRWLP